MNVICSILLLTAAVLMSVSLPGKTQEVPDLRTSQVQSGAIWLDSLDLDKMDQEVATPHAGRSYDGNPIKLGGQVYPHGVGTHANSRMEVSLKGAAVRFVSIAGLDDEVKDSRSASITFEVWVDGSKKADTGVLRGGDEPKVLVVDLTNAKRMLLVTTDAGDGNNCDHADWAGAIIELAPGAREFPVAEALEPETTPAIAPVDKSPVPAIHGATVVGTTPGRDFLFLVPATGEGPLTFSAKGLPAGLVLDKNSGIIKGRVWKQGEYVVELSVEGSRGRVGRKLKIVAGEHKLALTPPMGWNSWAVWAAVVDDKKVRDAADWLVKSGLAAHGYQYINIDDCWEGQRNSDGEISSNQKFPDMKALADYVHSKGLKLGIYSSPGPKTCAGFEGSFQHEEQDAATWAKWGIDYVKYDWCSYGSLAKSDKLEELQKPYRVMRTALDKAGRDIVYSLCQYGAGNVWEWGAKVGGNCWRTGNDIGDSWQKISRGFSQDRYAVGAGPGHWNDLDMMQLGELGGGSILRHTRLTQNEQLTHVTLWTLLASPILLSCDLSQLDDFTLALLTNDEVIDVHQDLLGRQADCRSRDDNVEVWARPLHDGTVAVGLFNRGVYRANVTAKWSDLGLQGIQPVRDLWRKQQLGNFKDRFTVCVPRHGAALVRIGNPAKSPGF